MTSRSATIEVALREIRTRGRTTAFRAITALLVLAAIAGPIIASIWPDGDSPREVTVGIANAEGDSDSRLREQILAISREDFMIEFSALEDSSSLAIDRSLMSGEIDVVVQLPSSVVWNETVDHGLDALIQAAIQQTTAVSTLESAGLSEQEIGQLFTPIEVSERFADESDSTNGARAAAAAALMAAFILPQVFGQLTMMSVVEEKSTGVIEVLLSHIRPRTLLLGKVLGLTLLALTQLVVFVAGLLAALLVTDALDVSRSVWQFVPTLLVSVLGGVVFYNTVFALLGSLISRQEDASQVMLPVFVPLMGGFIVGQTAIGGNAESLAARVLTLLPFTSSMLLPVRVARGAIEPWEIGLSLVLLGLGVWLLLIAAARVYEYTLLHAGSRKTWNMIRKKSRSGAT